MMKRTNAAGKIGIVVILFAVCFSGAARAGIEDCSGIKTAKGIVNGVLDPKGGVCSYKGIPYAAPPVGQLRFTLPKEHEPWTEPLEAKKFGDECIQFPMGLAPARKPSGSEDCLYLNIWQPVDASKSPKPVMVFIHGGGLVVGSGSENMYEGKNLAAAGGIIVATINYRLGAMGFMALPEFKDSEGRIGNYGLYDQSAAIRWIKDNAAAFGGDPDNITIAGQSAGGVSVGLQVLSPVSKGLFQKAIIQSGPVFLFAQSVDKAVDMGLKVAEKLGCKDAPDVVQCLREVDAKTFLSKARPGIMMMSGTDPSEELFLFGPVIDGKFIPDAPYRMLAQGDFPKDVKVMLGSNTDEATILTFNRKIETPEAYFSVLEESAKMVEAAVGIKLDNETMKKMFPVDSYPTPKDAYNHLVTDVAFICPAMIQAQLMVKNQSQVYVYYFGVAPSDKGMMKGMGAFHGAEVPFIFGNFNFMGLMDVSSEWNTKFSKTMMGLWSSFIRSGAPAADGVPLWPQAGPDGSPYLFLGPDEIAVRQGLKDDECSFVKSAFDKEFLK